MARAFLNFLAHPVFLLYLLPLEADHVKVKNKEPINETDGEIRNSRSLVVDIHLPPASEDEEVEEKPPVLSVPTSRPFKHEVNRFQRCYSDGSQSSPKRKGKVRKFRFLNAS